MKKLSIAGLVFAVLGALVGLYVMFEIAPSAAYYFNMESKSEADRTAWYYYQDQQIALGTGAMGAGLLGFLMAIVPALKTKERLSWVASGVAVVAFFLGAAYGTHMFS